MSIFISVVDPFYSQLIFLLPRSSYSFSLPRHFLSALYTWLESHALKSLLRRKFSIKKRLVLRLWAQVTWPTNCFSRHKIAAREKNQKKQRPCCRKTFNWFRRFYFTIENWLVGKRPHLENQLQVAPLVPDESLLLYPRKSFLWRALRVIIVRDKCCHLILFLRLLESNSCLQWKRYY